MSNTHEEFARQLKSVRPATRHLVTSVLLDAWPNLAATVDFGIDSQQHYEALYYPIRGREIMPQALDEAMGHGAKLTALVRSCVHNPHKDVAFHTSWDLALGRGEPQGSTGTTVFQWVEEPRKPRTKERDIEREM